MSEHDATIRDLQKSLEEMTWQRDRLAYELKNLRKATEWQKVNIAHLHLQIEELEKENGEQD